MSRLGVALRLATGGLLCGALIAFLTMTAAAAASADEIPDMAALGRYHFEYGQTQGWFAQAGESMSGASIQVAAAGAAAWTGHYGLQIGASGSPSGGQWWAAAGADNPPPGLTPTGTLAAHLYVPPGGATTWAQLYILDRDWQWHASPQAALQAGQPLTLTWHISATGSVPPALPIRRLGVQFGGPATGPFSGSLAVDALDWTRPVYTQSIATGAYLSGTWTSGFAAELAQLDALGGKHAGVINVFQGWPADYPLQVVRTIAAHGSTPLITWEPWVPLAGIVAGQYDGYIDAWAQGIRSTPGTQILLRWGHEMQGTWYPWSGDPTQYKAAWRYVHDRLQITDGVANVAWVWAPNIMQGSTYADYPDYYPGDAYVDWVGASGFNAAGQATWDPKPPCQSFDDLFSPILADLAARYPSKPQIVPEFASACANGCDKALWITEAYYQALSYPQLRALAWFNVAKWEGDGVQRRWIDWRLPCGAPAAPGCPACADAYAAALANPRYSAEPLGPLGESLYLPALIKG